jgi:hypothetical protein
MVMRAWFLAFLPLLALAEKNVTLTDGKPVVAYIASGTSGYFTIEYVTSSSEALTIELTPLGSTDPDLFANVHKPGMLLSRPNKRFPRSPCQIPFQPSRQKMT